VGVSDEMPRYRDRWIACTERHLVIRGYYFPVGTPKKLSYSDIPFRIARSDGSAQREG